MERVGQVASRQYLGEAQDAFHAGGRGDAHGAPPGHLLALFTTEP